MVFLKYSTNCSCLKANKEHLKLIESFNLTISLIKTVKKVYLHLWVHTGFRVRAHIQHVNDHQLDDDNDVDYDSPKGANDKKENGSGREVEEWVTKMQLIEIMITISYLCFAAFLTKNREIL